MNEILTFGRFFRGLRIRRGKTLREFCLENGFDAGNMSKLERDRLAPPHDRKKLERYAEALGVVEGSDEWYQFFDLAAIAAGRIPPALLTDQEVVARLPLVFRTLRNRKVDESLIDGLIETIRRS